MIHIVQIIIFCLFFCYADQWFKYDDDDVTMVTDEEIKKLSGGGKLPSSPSLSSPLSTMYICTVY